MYDILFFDLDGTLTDSSEGITKSIAYALEKMGVECDDLSTLLKYIGPPLSVSFRDYFQGDDIEKAVKLYRERYNETGWMENRVYDRVPEMLARLKAENKKIYMATSKPEHFAKRIAEYFGFAKYFDGICGATTDLKRNTKQEVLAYALEMGGVPLGGHSLVLDDTQVLMIGDRYYDVEGAGAFGIKTLGVTYGFGTKEELDSYGAIAAVDTPDAVADYILAK
ncbi:MAG: HAD hydrolase-like protein [Lachnospiraceae bacterium]